MLLTLLQDAAAAALFTACKIEDTLKKSRDILCAAYNLKLHPAEHLSPDDPVCELKVTSMLDLLTVYRSLNIIHAQLSALSV